MSGITHKQIVEENLEHWRFRRGQQTEGLVKLAGLQRRYGANEQEIVAILYVYRNRFEDFAEVEHEIPYIAHEIATWRPAEVSVTDLKFERGIARAKRERAEREAAA